MQVTPHSRLTPGSSSSRRAAHVVTSSTRVAPLAPKRALCRQRRAEKMTLAGFTGMRRAGGLDSLGQGSSRASFQAAVQQTIRAAKRAGVRYVLRTSMMFERFTEKSIKVSLV